MDNRVEEAKAWLSKAENIQGKSALQILQQLQKGTYGGNAKLRAWTHYDQVTLVTGAQELTAFDLKVGSPLKGIAVTNNPASGTIPSSSHFAFDALELNYVHQDATMTAAVKSTWDNFLNDWRIQMTIQELSAEHQFPLTEVFGNVAPLTILGTGVGDQVSTRNNLNGLRPFMGIPVVLAALTTYTVVIQSNVAIDAALNGDFVKIKYKGYKLSSN